MKPSYYIIVKFRRMGWRRIGNGNCYSSKTEAIKVAKSVRKNDSIFGAKVIKLTSALEFEC